MAQSWLKLCGACLTAIAVMGNAAHAGKFKLLARFTGGNGAMPFSVPTLDGTGNLYGTTFGSRLGVLGKHCSKSCGSRGSGYAIGDAKRIFFALRGDKKHAPPANPISSMTLGNDGFLYGTSEFGGDLNWGTVFRIGPGTTKVKVLYSFAGNNVEACPYAPLILDAAGNLYGTTAGRGEEGLCNIAGAGGGTVFELSPPRDGVGSWKERILFQFGQTEDDPTGFGPEGRLLFDQAGNLYGTTIYGGGAQTAGVIFRLNKPAHEKDPWTETILYNFNDVSNRDSGSNPISGLIMDANGSLYGTTTSGGQVRDYGVVFRLSPSGESWTFEKLWEFCDVLKGGVCTDGAGPWAPSGLVFDSLGNVYGTTIGGIGNYGTLFELSPPADRSQRPHSAACRNWCLKVLHTFASGAEDGAAPADGVIRDVDGTLYGTTSAGGSDNPHFALGTLYRLTRQ